MISPLHIERNMAVKKAHWLALFLALGLLVPFLPLPGRELAQPVSAGTSPAAAQSPILGPFINIWEDGVNNYKPAVAYNSLHDEYLVVWSHNSSSIRARRVSATGQLLGSEITLDAGLEGTHQLPSVAYADVADAYLVVWQAVQVTDALPYMSIAGRVLTSDGSLEGGAFYISRDTSGVC